MVSAHLDWVDTLARCVSDNRSTLLIALHRVVTESLSGIALGLDDNGSRPLAASQHGSTCHSERGN